MQNTTLCYIERDGCFLMLHRVKKEHDVNRDKWVAMAVRNVARSGYFASDRTIEEYNDKIWRLKPLSL